jgi:hypothetical protein
MGIPLVHTPQGKVDWFADVDGNWSTLESVYVARQKSDASIVTVSSTTSETALMSNTTIPANALVAGTVLAIWAAGSVTIPANATPSITFRLRWGGISGVVLATWTFNFGSNPTAYSLGWVNDHRLVCVSAGSSGSAELDGWMAADSAVPGLTSSTVTIDTTASKLLLWTAQPSLSTVSVSQRFMMTNKG